MQGYVCLLTTPSDLCHFCLESLGDLPIEIEGFSYCGLECYDELERMKDRTHRGALRCAECGNLARLDGCVCPGGTGKATP